MKPPKTTVGPVCLWLSILLLGVCHILTSWELVKGCHVRGLLVESVRRACVD
jgi:hypothetical protein